MRILLLSSLVALSLLAPAAADHCETWSTTTPDLYCGELKFPGTQPFYVDEDCCQMGCLYSIWVYEESNGLPGLQREDEVMDDTCHGQIRGDTVVF